MSKAGEEHSVVGGRALGFWILVPAVPPAVCPWPFGKQPLGHTLSLWEGYVGRGGVGGLRVLNGQANLEVKKCHTGCSPVWRKGPSWSQQQELSSGSDRGKVRASAWECFRLPQPVTRRKIYVPEPSFHPMVGAPHWAHRTNRRAVLEMWTRLK